MQDRNGKGSLFHNVPAIENQRYRSSAGVNSKAIGLLPYQLTKIVPDHGIAFVHIEVLREEILARVIVVRDLEAWSLFQASLDHRSGLPIE